MYSPFRPFGNGGGRLRRFPAIWRKTLAAALAVCLVGVLPDRAFAPPKGIGFRQMVAGCEVIAVARFAGPWDPREGDRSVELVLTRVLKGDIKPGTYRVRFTDFPKVSDDTAEFVAFLGRGQCWRFAAVPLSPEQGVADSVLGMRGFYDFNAYVVSPGLMTLSQIETFLKDGSLGYTIRGPLYFPRRGQAGWAASDIRIEVRYDARTGRSEVIGLPELKGFPVRPTVSVGSLFADNGVLLTYSRELNSPLEIRGRLDSTDPADGAMLSRFFVTAPDVPTREDFEGYAGDPLRGHSYYSVRIACLPFGGEPKPRILTLTDGKELGRIATLEGWADQPMSLARFGTDADRAGRKTARAVVKQDSGEELVLEFDLGVTEGEENEFAWSFREYLLYPLLEGDVPGRIVARKDGEEREVTTFTASLAKVEYARLGQPRAVEPGMVSGEANGSDGLESFACDDDVLMPRWEGWIPWLGVGILTLAGLCVVLRLRRRLPAVPSTEATEGRVE